MLIGHWQPFCSLKGWLYSKKSKKIPLWKNLVQSIVRTFPGLLYYLLKNNFVHTIHKKLPLLKAVSMQAPAKYFLKSNNNKEECCKKNLAGVPPIQYLSRKSGQGGGGEWGGETRDGWPLLTVETEANGDLWSKNESCPSLVGSLGSSCRYKRFLFCPLQNIFFLTLQTFSFYVSSSLSHLDRPVVIGRLSLNMSLWKKT